MKKAGLLIVVVVAVLLLSRRASARPAGRDVPTRGPAPSYGEVRPMNRADVDKALKDAMAQLDVDWTKGASLYEREKSRLDMHPAPLPPKLIAVIMSRESGGRDVRSVIGEQGPMQLTPDEVRTAGGGDCHDLEDSVRMAQVLYAKAIAAHSPATSQDEAFVAMLSRSIGPGATRWVLSRVAGPSAALVLEWLQSSPERPTGIRQSDYKFSLRLFRSLLRADRARTDGWLPVGRLPLAG